MTEEEIKNQLANYHKSVNIFSAFRMEATEIRHNNILAWLLDPNQTHGLKKAFQKKFIKKLKEKFTLTLDEVELEKVEFKKIERELDNMDISMVSDDSKVVITIENKIYASEGRNQLQKYQTAIPQKYYKDWKHIFFKLSLQGDLPQQDIDKTRKVWNVIRYSDVLECLEKLQKHTMPLMARAIISDYIDTLKFYLCVDKNIMNFMLSYNAFDDKPEQKLMEKISEMIPQPPCKVWRSKKIIRFQTPALSEFFKNKTEDENSSFWEDCYYAYEFQIKDNILNFQLVFKNSEEEKYGKMLEKLKGKFISTQEQWIPRPPKPTKGRPRPPKPTKWYVVKKMSVEIKKGKDIKGFLTNCAEALNAWEKEIVELLTGSLDKVVEIAFNDIKDPQEREDFAFLKADYSNVVTEYITKGVLEQLESAYQNDLLDFNVDDDNTIQYWKKNDNYKGNRGSKDKSVTSELPQDIITSIKVSKEIQEYLKDSQNPRDVDKIINFIMEKIKRTAV